MMDIRKLKIGEEINVTTYSMGNEHLDWHNFHGRLLKMYEHSALIDVEHSKELPLAQRRLVNGKIVVSFADLGDEWKPKPVKKYYREQAPPKPHTRGFGKLESKNLQDALNHGMTWAQAAKAVGISESYAKKLAILYEIQQPTQYHVRFTDNNGNEFYIKNKSQLFKCLSINWRDEAVGDSRKHSSRYGWYEFGIWTDAVEKVRRRALDPKWNRVPTEQGLAHEL